MDFRHSQQILALVAGFMLLAFYQSNPDSAWACSTSGASGFSYSAQNSGSSVTVCATTVVQNRTAIPAKPILVVPAPKPVAPKPIPAKPAPKPVVVTPPKPAPKVAPKPTVSLITSIKTGVPAVLQKPVTPVVSKPVVKPTPIPASTPKPTVKPTVNPIAPATQLITATSAAELSFSPNPLVVASSYSNLSVGEYVNFFTNAVPHYRSGVLLGKSAEVHFIPIQYSWSFGDGSGSSASNPDHAFSGVGSKSISATVTYSVSYQIQGASGWIDSGTISVTDQISVQVQGATGAIVIHPTIPTPEVVRLVAKNCFDNPGTFGCSP